MKAGSVVVAFLSLFVADEFKTIYGRHVEDMSKFDASVIKMISDAIPYFDCNGAGIGIIIGVIVFIAGIAGLICRRRYVARTTYVHGSPGVSVVQSSTAQSNLGYVQAPPPYSVAPKAY